MLSRLQKNALMYVFSQQLSNFNIGCSTPSQLRKMFKSRAAKLVSTGAFIDRGTATDNLDTAVCSDLEFRGFIAGKSHTSRRSFIVETTFGSINLGTEIISLNGDTTPSQLRKMIKSRAAKLVSTGALIDRGTATDNLDTVVNNVLAISDSLRNLPLFLYLSTMTGKSARVSLRCLIRRRRCQLRLTQ